MCTEIPMYIYVFLLLLGAVRTTFRLRLRRVARKSCGPHKFVSLFLRAAALKACGPQIFRLTFAVIGLFLTVLSPIK